MQALHKKEQHHANEPYHMLGNKVELRATIYLENRRLLGGCQYWKDTMDNLCQPFLWRLEGMESKNAAKTHQTELIPWKEKIREIS